jgi:phosphatidylglycerophosphate synthase
VGRPPLTLRRLFGLDRSGPPPAATLRDAPWNPWTLPNAIGFIRLALIPVFLILALSSEDGTDVLAVVIFAVVGWSDYLDGIAARVTGQYSRLGALLDPVVDRLLVLREISIVVLARIALTHDRDLRINWPGRAAVWPVMSAIFLALCGVEEPAVVLLVVGLVLAMLALALYVRDGLQPST